MLPNEDSCIGWRSFWGRRFNQQEVMAVIKLLAEDGNIEVCIHAAPDSPCSPVSSGKRLSEEEMAEAWFHLTPNGLRLWQSWLPPVQGAT